MTRKKLGVNDPCPCGSKRKYKKCHLGYFDKWGNPIVPKGVQNATDQYLRPKFPHGDLRQLIDQGILSGRPFIETEFKGNRMRAVGSHLYRRPLNETFHEFIINHLRDTLKPNFGDSWGTVQETLPPTSRHPIYAWYEEMGDLSKTRVEESEIPGVFQIQMSGNEKALRALAFDFYTLEHHGVSLRKEHWRRLQDVNHFQGVRYEISIAAMACRAGFEVEWCGGKNKHGEFIGTHTLSGQKAIFEAKSHHRGGVLGRQGEFDPSVAKIKIIEHLTEAVEQTKNTGLPLIFFDDMNLPIGEEKVNHQKWFKDIQNIFDKDQLIKPFESSHYGAIVITNFAWHFHEDLPVKRESDVITYWHVGGRYSIDPSIIRLLTDSAKQYGTVPPMLEEKPNVNS